MMVTGETIVVTGGNSGIGAAIAAVAGREGANVVTDYVTHPEARLSSTSPSPPKAVRRSRLEADASRSEVIPPMTRIAPSFWRSCHSS
jgi:glucose 1-dehydrogenase